MKELLRVTSAEEILRRPFMCRSVLSTLSKPFEQTAVVGSRSYPFQLQLGRTEQLEILLFARTMKLLSQYISKPL